MFTSNAAPSVPENTTAVVILAATDADRPAQTVSFSLTGGADQAQFEIVAGQLRFKTAPDYEVPTDANTDNKYVVQVTGTDSGTPALATVQTVSVTVTPVNDNSPVFTSNAAPSVPENTTAVVILAATDADQPGQTVGFSLTGGADQGKFQIVGGQLQFQTAPDYEVPTDANTDNKYVVQVTGTDGGTPALATVQTVTVTVTPVNDNTPVFTSNAAQRPGKHDRRRDLGGHRRGPAGADGQLQPDGRGGPGQVPDRGRPVAVPDGPGLRGADGRQHGQQVRGRGDGHGQRDSGVGHGADRDGDGHAGERQPAGVHVQRNAQCPGKHDRRRDPGGHRRGPAGADGQLQPDGRGGPGQVPDRGRPVAVPDGPGLRGADGRQHGQQVRGRGDGHGQRDSGVGHGADRDGDGHAGERQPAGIHVQRGAQLSRRTRPAS